VIRNASSKRHRAARLLKAQHRWCLTGTPIYNRVEDFGALLAFLRAHPFDSATFNRHVLSPLKKNPMQGIQNLRNLVQSISLRRTKASVLGDLQLPPRITRVEEVHLNSEERRLYNILKQGFSKILHDTPLSFEKNISSGSMFQTILRLRQFCNHGRDLLPPQIFSVFDENTGEEQSAKALLEKMGACESCGAEAFDRDLTRVASVSFACGHRFCSTCMGEIQKDGGSGSQDCPLCFGLENTTGLVPVDKAAVMDTPTDYQPSSKVLALLRNLLADRDVPGEDPVKRCFSLVSFSHRVQRLLTGWQCCFHVLDKDDGFDRSCPEAEWPQL